MPLVDLIDETFIRAPPSALTAAVHDREFWSKLWPGLRLRIDQDRAGKGIRWLCDGQLAGSAEVWLEPYASGVIVHCYLRVDPTSVWSPRRLRRESRQRQLQVKRVMFALKDRLEVGLGPTSAVK
ncbi:MAG: polyketide cyclase / dehydrase and lipid transport [Mycobacteriales bacterium]